jgi:WD40 repeat protein
VWLWDIATHRAIGTPLINPFTGSVTSVAVSPDGTTLATGSTDGTAQLWNRITHQSVGPPLTGHTGPVTSVAFSPDGKALAAGYADDTIQLWNVATHHPLGSPLAGHGGPVTSVAFSPDGKTLASGSYDGTVRLWNLATPSHNLADATNLVQYLCALAGRPLTPAEWAHYVPNLEYRRVCP